jgi:predicted nucleic acid-binding protein
MILVDTNVWSEALKAAPEETVESWARAHESELRLSAVVLAELRAGASVLPEGRRRSTLETHFDELAAVHADRTLPFDLTTAEHYARVLETAKRRGRPIGTADAMIAATAIQHGMRLATRDLGDFAGADVDLIDPWAWKG